jgi:hypothetical protein
MFVKQVRGTGNLRLFGVHDNDSSVNNYNVYCLVSSVLFKIGSYLFFKMLIGSVGELLRVPQNIIIVRKASNSSYQKKKKNPVKCLCM